MDHAELVDATRDIAGGDHTAAPETIPDLRARLSALGVPDAYLPPVERPTLDALACALGTLPSVPALATGAGEIVVVVGEEGPVERTAALLLGALRLGRRDVVRCTLDDGDQGGNDSNHGGNDSKGDDGDDRARRVTAAKVNAAVRVAKRRAKGATSLVTVSTSPDPQAASDAADIIDCIRPHTVLAAVDASVKRADVEAWLHGVGPVEALAVWGLEQTHTPGELLGAAPIAYADGMACTATSWTASLLAQIAGDDPA